MKNINTVPEHKPMDHIDIIVRARYARPSLYERFRRQVISRRRG
jgi:hypothetical protein